MEEFKTVLNVAKVLVVLLPIVCSLHLYFYNKSPKYYFKIAKIFSKWRDTNWKIAVIFTVNKNDTDFYGSFEEILRSRYGQGNFRKNFNLKNKKLYEFNNLAVTIQSDLDISSTDVISIELLFNNVNVTYKNAENMLKDIRCLFHEVEKKIPIIEKNYNMNIKFNSIKNPFYGLMIQRLGEEHVEYFECVFPLSLLLDKNTDGRTRESYKLRVLKDYIVINEVDFDAVEDIAKKCLLLGG